MSWCRSSSAGGTGQDQCLAKSDMGCPNGDTCQTMPTCQLLPDGGGPSTTLWCVPSAGCIPPDGG
jgi:hypothetical protein